MCLFIMVGISFFSFFFNFCFIRLEKDVTLVLIKILGDQLEPDKKAIYSKYGIQEGKN